RGIAALEGNIREFLQTWELAHGNIFVAIAILNSIGVGRESATLGETGDGDPVDFHQEVEPRPRISEAARLGHVISPSIDRSDAASSVFWRKRKITNSAGLTGAMPM